MSITYARWRLRERERRRSREYWCLEDGLEIGDQDRHLEEIHVTWAQFWKKPNKMANRYEEGTKNCKQNVEMTSGKDAMPSRPYSDDA
ncbi:hypothetical protein Tco_0736112 [Tanacetum coccineum]